MFIIVEEALISVSRNQGLQALTEDLKVIDTNLKEEELASLVEALSQDEELLVEFLGTIAGLGGKFASRLGSKVSGFGNRLQAYSQKKALGREQQQSKLAHRSAVRAYGKSLKGGDPNTRSQALASLVAARHQNRVSHGRAQDPSKVLGTSRQGSPKTGYNYITNSPKMQNKLQYKEKGGRFNYLKTPSSHANIYRRLGEAIIHQINEGSLGRAKTERIDSKVAKLFSDKNMEKALKYNKIGLERTKRKAKKDKFKRKEKGFKGFGGMVLIPNKKNE